MITYCPLNARSELMSLVNCPWGGVFDTWRRFQIADPASNNPGFKPTLGSGLGATVDSLAPPPQARDKRAIAAETEYNLIVRAPLGPRRWGAENNVPLAALRTICSGSPSTTKLQKLPGSRARPRRRGT